MPESAACRVVISGLGVVAPNGVGKRAFWQNLMAGKSFVDYITAFDPSPYPCEVAAEVRDFVPADFMRRRSARELWRFTQFALAASRMAIEDAQLPISPSTRHRIGACFGTCVSGIERVYESFETVRQSGYKDLHPLTSFQYSTHAPVAHVTVELGLQGPSITLASGCSTGLDVIKWAYDQVRAGTASAIIAGSTEAPLTPMVFSTWAALGILARKTKDPRQASRPYDATRDGLVLGEGAGAVVIESLDSAKDRGAPVYAEICGFAIGSEAIGLRKVEPTGSTLARTIQQAVARSGLRTDQIDYINAHGNSSPDNDAAETAAFKAALGSSAYSTPISSIKSMIGQPIAASGILQAISTALSLRHNAIPPTANYRFPDPACDLDYVPNTARCARVDRAIINAHAIGGTHSVLVLTKPESTS
jgi:3-oxoacyl-[acyl-carrier-protein] synthase II